MPLLLLLLTLALACTPAAPVQRPSTNMTFKTYIALGDSISIDSYPASDASRRFAGRASTTKLGAASLLYANDDRLWPEFEGRDLRTLYPGIAFENLTSDGATTPTFLRQVEQIDRDDAPTLVTITIGGNDLLGSIGSRGPSPSPAIAERLRTGVARILELRPNALVLISTVYDPSDGTNRLPGRAGLNREAQWLREYNEAVKALAATDPRLRLADIHRHFLGHGMSVPEEQWWYLRESIIEPGARGASEVRRLWLEASGAAGA